MKYILCLWLAVVVSPAAFAADLPDTEAIDCSWTPIKAELGGQPMPDAVLKTISLKLEDGRYEVMADGHPDNGTYSLDAAVQPKSMTIEVTGNESKVEKFLSLMTTFGIRDLTRTGKVAIARKDEK